MLLGCLPKPVALLATKEEAEEARLKSVALLATQEAAEEARLKSVALLATQEAAEKARLKSVADALYQGLKGPSEAPPRHASTVVPSSRPTLKLKFVGEGPGQVVYMARPSQPRVLPGGQVAVPLQVGWCCRMV